MKRTFESKEPVLFMKPDTALLKDGNPFFLPDFSDEIHYETELVVKINRLGKNIGERFAHRYYDEITLGIDLPPYWFNTNIEQSLQESLKLAKSVLQERKEQVNQGFDQCFDPTFSPDGSRILIRAIADGKYQRIVESVAKIPL